MTIKEYIDTYTSGERITFLRCLDELRELIIELVKLNNKGVREEFQDFLHFVQLWLFWRFGVNGKIWKITSTSINKFIDRKDVWNRIYSYVGLPENISGYMGNYKKISKVIIHLDKLGISNIKAEESYREIVLKLEEHE